MSESGEHHGHPRFYELLREMERIHDAKNHDYAGKGDPLKNFKLCAHLAGIPAWHGAYVRLLDKVSRVGSFIESGELHVKSEKIADTLLDLANYALIALILVEEDAHAPE